MAQDILRLPLDVLEGLLNAPRTLLAAKELALSHDETVRSLKPIFQELVTVLTEIKLVLQKSQDEAARHSKEASIATTEAHDDAKAAADTLGVKNSEAMADFVASAIREYAAKRGL